MLKVIPPDQRPPKPKDDNLCNHYMVKKNAYCKNPRIEGKAHCSMHKGRHRGSAIIDAKGKPQNMGSRELSKLGLLIQKHKNNTDPFNLQEEVATLRALKEYAQSANEQYLEKNPLVLAGLMDIIEKISRVVERHHKIQEGEKFKIEITSVNFIVVKIIEIVKRYVPDETTRSHIADEILSLQIPQGQNGSNHTTSK